MTPLTTSRVLALVILAALPIALVADTAWPAPPEPAAGSAAEALTQELLRDPEGVVIGNEIHRPDGSVFVAVDADTRSLNQCDSGSWCMWESTNYQGSFSYRTGTGVTYTLSGTIHSVFNNRGNAARLFSNTGASSTCYAAGERSASLSASYYSAEKVRLLAGDC